MKFMVENYISFVDYKYFNIVSLKDSFFNLILNIALCANYNMEYIGIFIFFRIIDFDSNERTNFLHNKDNMLGKIDRWN